jgi:hypothetical protein
MLNSNGVKLKNIQLSFIVLASLIVLSFAFYVSAENNSATSNNIFADSDQDGLSDQEEKIYGTDPHNKDTDNDGYTDGVEVSSGYDPLKPAPGDKIIPANSAGQTNAPDANQENLTKKLAYQITQMTQDPSQSSNIDTGTVQSLVDQIIPEDSGGATGQTETEAPVFTKDDFKIKSQNYAKLGDKKAQEQRKEDFIEYVSAIFYIFSSNSTQPITSGTDINSVMNSMVQKMISAFAIRDAKQLDDMSASGEKMMEQMKNIEVPEEMIDIHIQALTFAKYAEDMKDYINPDPADPISDIQNLTKVSGLVSNSAELFTQIEDKFNEYDLMNNVSLINDKIQELEKNRVGN